MKLSLPFRSRLFLGGALATLIALMAIPVFASIPGPGGVINGCFQKSTGKLRVIDPAATKPSLRACHRDEVAIHWNQVGPAGPQGSPGPQGPPGLSAYEEVSHQEFITAGAVANVNVSCSAGKKVLGGGYDIETPTDVKVFSSEPSDGHGNIANNKWNVLVHNEGTVTRQVTVTAICAIAQ